MSRNLHTTWPSCSPFANVVPVGSEMCACPAASARGGRSESLQTRPQNAQGRPFPSAGRHGLSHHMHRVCSLFLRLRVLLVPKETCPLRGHSGPPGLGTHCTAGGGQLLCCGARDWRTRGGGDPVWGSQYLYTPRKHLIGNCRNERTGKTTEG